MMIFPLKCGLIPVTATGTVTQCCRFHVASNMGCALKYVKYNTGGQLQKYWWQQKIFARTKTLLGHNYYCENSRKFLLRAMSKARWQDMCITFQFNLEEKPQLHKPGSSFQWNKRIHRVRDAVPAVCLLYIWTKGQTIQTILPLRHAVQWHLCPSHVPSDKAPSSPDICQPAASSASQERRPVAELAVSPPRWMLCCWGCHMPPDGGGITSPAWTPTVRLIQGLRSKRLM